MKQQFSVLSNTGKDDLVLGMPWLIGYDPQIDWANRSISFRKEKGELSEGVCGPSVISFALNGGCPT